MVLTLSIAWACSETLSRDAALSDAVEAVDDAVRALDPEALATAATTLRSALGCRRDAIRIDDAARVHRALGIEAFVVGRREEADLWFAASRALDPTAEPGTALGGPLLDAWNRSLSETPPQRSPLDPPRRGRLVIDGQITPSYPAFLPFVFQHVDGTDVQTAVVSAGSTPPSYPGHKPAPDPEVRPRQKRFTILAVSTAGLAGITLGGAGWTRHRYRDPGLSDDSAQRMLQWNRGLGVTGTTLGGVSLALGTAAVLTGEW